MNRRLDRDLLNNTAPDRVARAVMGILNAMQDFAPHDQVLASAAVFRELADHWRVSPSDAFTAVSNITHHRDGSRRPEFLAVRPYIENELGA